MPRDGSSGLFSCPAARGSFACPGPVAFEFTPLAHGSTVLVELGIAIERRDGGRRIERGG